MRESVNDPRDTILSVHHVQKSYALGNQVLSVLRDITLDVERGEFVALMGPSGSGKSTLMNLIGMLDRPDSGTVGIDGVDVTRVREHELPRLRREKIGFVFQTFNLLPRLSARKNVMLPMVYNRVPHQERLSRAASLLTSVGLAERAHHAPNELSGGERQRVAIARAIANKPSILLADEPTGNLDSTSGKAIMELMKRLNEEGMTILLVTHNEELLPYTHRVIRMLDGRIVENHTR